MKEGKYHAHIIKRSIFESQKTESVGLTMELGCYERLTDDGEWVPEQPVGIISGTVWIMGRDGNANDLAIEALQQATGWDGTIDQWLSDEWQPNDVETEAAFDEYKGRRTLKARWVNRIVKPGEAPPPPPQSQIERIKRKLAAAREINVAAQREGPRPPDAPQPPDSDIPF